MLTMLYSGLFLLSSVLAAVHATCPLNAVSAIKNSWNGNGPTGAPQKMLGLLTYVTAPEYFANVSGETYGNCYQIPVQYWSDYNPKHIFNPRFGDLKMKENEPGVITLSDDYPEDDRKLYIISINNGVLVYFDCQVIDDDNDPPPFAVIAIINLESSDLTKYQADIDAGKNKLKQLGLPFYQTIKTDCFDKKDKPV